MGLTASTVTSVRRPVCGVWRPPPAMSRKAMTAVAAALTAIVGTGCGTGTVTRRPR